MKQKNKKKSPKQELAIPAAKRTSLVSAIVFRDDRPLGIDEVLTNIKRWQAYTPEYLEKKVNENLAQFLASDLGVSVAGIVDFLALDNPALVRMEGSGIVFPDGRFESSFVGDRKKAGSLFSLAIFEGMFLEQFWEISGVLDCLRMSPNLIRLKLTSALDPVEIIPALKKKKWKVVSQLPMVVEASHLSYCLKIEPDSVELTGFSPQELFGEEGKNSILSAILGMFSA